MMRHDRRSRARRREAPPAAHRPPCARALAAGSCRSSPASCLLFLFLPIGVMIAFSFNDPAGRQNMTWQGFTLRNYVDLWARSQVTDPMLVSIAIAAVSTTVATTFGTHDRAGADPLPSSAADRP